MRSQVARKAARASRVPTASRERGVTLTECVVALGVVLALAATAVATGGGSRDALAAAGAARYLASRIHQVRAASLTRGVHAALVFRPVGTEYCYATVVDGNRNGIRTADISAGVDRQVERCERLSDHFAGATLGVGPGVTDPEWGTPLTNPPVRLGGSSVLSFGPDGGSTSGTLYLRASSGPQYAVRIFGTTGRTRILRFDARSGQWGPP